MPGVASAGCQDGPYDKIASVGMYEHVGAAQLDAYAATIAGLLRAGGLALNHGISRLHSERPGSKSFVNRFVFPDGSCRRSGCRSRGPTLFT